jgi:hypothetical protein
MNVPVKTAVVLVTAPITGALLSVPMNPSTIPLLYLLPVPSVILYQQAVCMDNVYPALPAILRPMPLVLISMNAPVKMVAALLSERVSILSATLLVDLVLPVLLTTVYYPVLISMNVQHKMVDVKLNPNVVSTKRSAPLRVNLRV